MIFQTLCFLRDVEQQDSKLRSLENNRSAVGTKNYNFYQLTTQVKTNKENILEI